MRRHDLLHQFGQDLNEANAGWRGGSQQPQVTRDVVGAHEVAFVAGVGNGGAVDDGETLLVAAVVLPVAQLR